MNRESKRMMERRNRRGTTDAAGASTATDEPEVGAEGFGELSDVGPLDRTGPDRARARTDRQHTTPFQFLREIRDEMRQVAWPNRAEMVNYSMVVFFTLVIMILLIFLLNLAFGKGVLFLFQK